MKNELTDVSPTRKEIRIEIEPALIRSTMDRISQEYSKAAKVPGFRPGHAPTSVVRTRYKNEIRNDLLRELLPDAVNSAIDEHSLKAIGEPDVRLDNEEALERLGQEPLTVKIGVEVLPEVTLNEYKGLEATRRERQVTDADIDRTIEGLRDASASLEPVEDRGAELGEIVTINAVGKPLDQEEIKPEDEIKVEDVEVTLGGQGVQQEFTDNLIGAKPEDKRTFTVDYPADFSTPTLAGKKVEYEIDVTAVRRKVLPEVDDEWVKSLGENFDTVETLKTKIREDLSARAKFDADRRVRDDVMRQLLDSHKFEVPESLVNHQTQQRLQNVVREMMNRGVDPRNANMNWEGASEELKVQAEADVRASMLLEQIAEAENITVSDEEVEAEIDAITLAYQQPKEQVRAALTKDGGERSIAHRLRNRKALDLLIQNAKITEAEWTESNKDSEAEPSKE
jgi:trigger factor